ncbi:MAG TPA: cell division protein ZapA [Treponema sp.]|nr:cell division protein ZapA [Treponema sp.]
MGTLQIDVLGSSFTIRANEETEYLEKLLGYYKRITADVEKAGGLKNPIEVAIMSGITLCDELYKEKSKNVQIESSSIPSEEAKEAERLTLEMIDKIDKVLN